MRKQFGGRVRKEHELRYAQSKNWDGKKFVNLEETKMNISIQTLPKILYRQFCKTEGRVPVKKIPIAPFSKESFLAPSEKAKIIWYGHSVVLMRINNKTLLIDPMLGPDAAPVAPFSIKRFSENTLSIIDQLPEIDLLLLTHDHYDHLDLDSMEKLKQKARQYFAALGVGRHLMSWGISNDIVTEFDWWNSQLFEDISITFTPTRHFSGRGVSDRAKSLWGGWAINSGNENLYFSGDSGYGKHFAEVGKRLGPFDFGLMECGQYNENWHAIHMYPEESVQAALDSGVKKAMAVHWAGFALAQHHWKDPIERFEKEAALKGLSTLTPAIGEQFNTASDSSARWWEAMK